MRRLLSFLILVILLVSQALAGVVNMWGGETGDGSESPTMGSGTISTVQAHGGTYAGRWNIAGAAANPAQLGSILATGRDSTSTVLTSTNYFRGYIYVVSTAVSSVYVLQLRASGLNMLQVRLNTDRTMGVDERNGTFIATGTTVLTTNTWHRIEVKWGPMTTHAPYELKIDGAVELSGSDAVNSDSSVQFLQFGPSNGNPLSMDIYMDDISWRDDQYPGAGQIKLMGPTGDSASNTGFAASAGSKFGCLDEIPPNAYTDYIESTSSAAYTATLASSGSVGISGTINCAKAFTLAKCTSGTSAVSLRVRSGSTNFDTTSLTTLNTTSRCLVRAMTVDPNTTLAWTSGNLDAAETGISSTNTSTIDADATGMMVDYTASTSPKSQGTMTGIGLSLVRGGLDEIADERRRAA